MIRTASLAAASLAALAVAAPAASAAQPHAVQDLYVATANKGSLARTQTPGVYRLTMAQPSPSVTTFTDRPNRQASALSTREFVHDWAQEGFKADPPNAALVVDGAPATRDVYTFELAKPRIDKQGRMVLRAKRIGPPSSGPLEAFGKRADKPAAGRFGHASLFVDAGAPTQTPVHVTVNNLAPGQAVDLQFNQVVNPTPTEPVGMRVSGQASSEIDDGSLLITTQQQTLTNGSWDISISGASASGTATIPPGASVSIAVGNGPAQPIADGAFNVG